MQTYIDVSWTFEVVEKIPLQQIGDRRMIRNERFFGVTRVVYRDWTNGTKIWIWTI